jgi:archaeal cell division control protein 6
MGLFKDMLKDSETLFKNTIALDYDYVPKLIPFREKHQHFIATCVKPLFMNRNARNVVIHGLPGVGKTVACKKVLNEIEEETDDIYVLYVNCWQKNTSYKVIIDICEQLGYKLTHNKKSDELFSIARNMVNKKAAVFVFDEVDKLEDYDFLYYILEEIYRKSIITITNYKDWIQNLDQRIKSRLTAEIIEFQPYDEAETREILRQRIKYAFVDNVWDEDAIEIAVTKTAEMGDVRSGLYLLREAGNLAEDSSSTKITKDHILKAIEKLDEFSIKKKEELEDDLQDILEIVKENSGKKIGDAYKAYQAKGGKAGYKTFQRKIKKLSESRFITVTKTTGGAEGTTSILEYKTATKKLTDF